MKGFKAIFLMCSLPAAVFAQKNTADSLYTFQQDRQLIDYVQQNGTQLISSGIEKLSTASVKYQTANGHYRRSQQAESGMEASFGTSGIATLGKCKLYGDFKFSRVWQDSLAWTFKGVPDDINPYYFAAIKAGPFQRINYTINALAVYPLIGDKVYIASGINYFYNTASRSVDPRPSVQTFQLKLTPELIFKHKQQTLGFGLLWGYEHEDNSVGFRNIEYSAGGAFYPDRILYQITGYGTYYSTGSTGRNLRRVGDFIGGSFNYAFTGDNKYLRAQLSYNQHNEDELVPKSQSVNYTTLGSFYLEHYELTLLAATNGKKYRKQLYAKIYYEPGKDINGTLHASSYKYRGLSAQADYTVQIKSTSSVNTEFGISGLYYDQSQRDLSASHTLNFNYIQPGVQAGLYKKYANNSRMKFTLAPALKIPVSSYLAIPSGEENVAFNNGVSYPDYAYFTSTAGILNGSVEYTTPHLLSGLSSSLVIFGTYTRQIKTGIVNPAGTFTPSGSFLNTSFSFNIYF